MKKKLNGVIFLVAAIAGILSYIDNDHVILKKLKSIVGTHQVCEGKNYSFIAGEIKYKYISNEFISSNVPSITVKSVENEECSYPIDLTNDYHKFNEKTPKCIAHEEIEFVLSDSSKNIYLIGEKTNKSSICNQRATIHIYKKDNI